VGWKACWKWVSSRWRKVSWLVHIRRAGGREFQILGAATLKLWKPNEVQTNGAHNKDSVRYSGILKTFIVDAYLVLNRDISRHKETMTDTAAEVLISCLKLIIHISVEHIPTIPRNNTATTIIHDAEETVPC